MYTYSGDQVDEEGGSPSVSDVAIGLGRIPRLCGAGRVWWTYLHYAFALMEVALRENQRYYRYDEAEVAAQALVREAHSAVTLLWPQGREFKDELQQRIHQAWDVPYPHLDSAMRELIDRAATRAFVAEVDCFAPGSMRKLPIFGEAPFEDQQIIRGVWWVQSEPSCTIGDRCEAVAAYTEFFKNRDLTRLRHQIGYDKSFWFVNMQKT
jgi:hypothetical protein